MDQDTKEYMTNGKKDMIEINLKKERTDIDRPT